MQILCEYSLFACKCECKILYLCAFRTAFRTCLAEPYCHKTGTRPPSFNTWLFEYYYLSNIRNWFGVQICFGLLTDVKNQNLQWGWLRWEAALEHRERQPFRWIPAIWIPASCGENLYSFDDCTFLSIIFELVIIQVSQVQHGKE